MAGSRSSSRRRPGRSPTPRREIHKRIGRFVDPLARVGRALGSAVSAYNEAVGSFESRVIPQLRRIEAAGATSGRDVELAGVEESPRVITASLGGEAPGAARRVRRQTLPRATSASRRGALVVLAERGPARPWSGARPCAGVQARRSDGSCRSDNAAERVGDARGRRPGADATGGVPPQRPPRRRHDPGCPAATCLGERRFRRRASTVAFPGAGGAVSSSAACSAPGRRWPSPVPVAGASRRQPVRVAVASRRQPAEELRPRRSGGATRR